ncbi:unnamed protein product, partial [Mesorhabditis belari]|uniref:Ig-like domain-containing protein n=1 Tax=Mesorhabditis belari TaxID=2138241 RepID=A0AAF3FHY6_9BILA
MFPQLLLIASLSLTFGDPCRRFSVSNKPSIECISSSLTHLPTVPTDVISVTLFNNSITSIDNFPGSYDSVQEISLRYCGIERVTSTAFRSLKAVTRVDLSHNSISTFIVQNGLRNVTWLSLAHNGLRFVPDLSALTALKFLDLSYNALYRVNPRSLPVQLNSLSLGHNRISVLQPWTHLTHLQEVNVVSNPLQCDCSLWEWVAWADKRSLVDPSTLPCNETVAQMRLYSAQKQSCGPIVEGEAEVEKVDLAPGTIHCSLLYALPIAAVHWIHLGIVLGQTDSTTTNDGAKVRHCIEIKEGAGDAYGEYQCVASASGRNSSKNVILFVFVFCFASYCIIRRDRSRTKTEDLYRRGHVIPILVDDAYEKPKVEHRLQLESPCPAVHRHSTCESSEWLCDGWVQPRVVHSLYRDRRDPREHLSPRSQRTDTKLAPLAYFDPESRHSLTITHTAV